VIVLAVVLLTLWVWDRWKRKQLLYGLTDLVVLLALMTIASGSQVLARIIIVFVVISVWVLGHSVLYLFQKHKELESRLQAVETVSEPFASKLAKPAPVPLERVIHVHIHFDETFWRETLQLSSEAIEKIKTSVPLHNEFSKGGLEHFDKWFYADILIRIQVWRGDYRRIEVEGPLQERTSLESYPGGRSHGHVWSLSLPYSEAFSWPTLALSVNESCVKLSASGGRFGDDYTPPSSPNIFLSVPLTEGRAAAEFHKPDYKIETWPHLYEDVKPWLRCYQNLDLKKGIAWQLWIRDCDLFARSEGISYRADSCLLDDYRKILSDRRTCAEDRAFYQQLVDSIEARRQAEHLRSRDERLDCDEATGTKAV